MSTKLGCSGRKCQTEHTSKEEKPMPRFKAVKDRLTLMLGG
jgi:hypothetical protein